ncbi:MAG: Transcriptional regulator, LysR family [uncultured Paraburkholderia sp.]|nr:MAG: Transcriptional regulator, LysR family [uncultured Paraburkholderia sp.]
MHIRAAGLSRAAVLQAIQARRPIAFACLLIMDNTAASLNIWLVRVLRKLRETLNDPILVRGKSGMVPTEYGESLRPLHNACCARPISWRRRMATSTRAARAARFAWPRPII